LTNDFLALSHASRPSHQENHTKLSGLFWLCKAVKSYSKARKVLCDFPDAASGRGVCLSISTSFATVMNLKRGLTTRQIEKFIYLY
jgi:hypothetical protein